MATGVHRLGVGTQAPSVALRNVSYLTSGRTLVDSVSLDLRAGEVLAIVGPNGAGKSTMLRLIAGDLTPTSGEALIANRQIAAMPAKELARLRAVLPQQTLLQFAFTVEEVVAMGHAPQQQRSPEAAREMIDWSMGRTETLHLRDRTYPTLSGGEQSRVSLARVLAQTTPILLLDEPTAALDLRHQQLVMAVARDLAREGAVVVAILHDLNLAASWADRIALMANGQLRAVGSPWEVLEVERIGAVFGCPVAIVPNPIRDCPLVLPLSDGRFKTPDTTPDR